MNNLRFLSKSELENKELLLDACKSHVEQLEDEEDKEILQNLLADFSENNWSFLTQQEMDFLNNYEQKIWADYLIFRWKFKNFNRLGKIPKFPLYLLVEPASVCNLRCSMCFQIDKTFSSNRDFMGKMDFDLFKKIIDQAVEGGTKAITLASRGEPTLNPNFGKMLEYCTDKFYEIKINTNALLLREETMHDILKAKVRFVVFSADAFDAEGYLRLRKSTKWDTLVANVKKFHEIRAKHYPNSLSITRVNGVKVEDDFDSNQFHKFWGEIADEVTLSNCVTRWDTYNNPLTKNTKPCTVGFDRLYIWYDGKCNPCDADYKSVLSPGNVKDNTISEIWNGKNYQAFRNTHFAGKRAKLNPCDRCEL